LQQRFDSFDIELRKTNPLERCRCSDRFGLPGRRVETLLCNNGFPNVSTLRKVTKIINRKLLSFRGRDRVRSIADSRVDRFDLLHRRAHTGVECDALCAKNKFVQTFADAPIRPLSPSTRSHQQNGHRRFPSFDRYESTLRFETRQQAVHLHNRLRHAAGARPSNDVSRTETGSPELRERRTATNRNSLALISLLASEWLNY
jgi:hypothetical protein